MSFRLADSDYGLEPSADERVMFLAQRDSKKLSSFEGDAPLPLTESWKKRMNQLNKNLPKEKKELREKTIVSPVVLRSGAVAQ
jgi:hypothetical protein